MKTISDEQRQLIDEVIADNSSALSPAALEKDILVTEALRAISQIKLPGLALTFSGGTCLSKAYGLLQRMSEDIDLRLVIEGQNALSRSALRRVLRELKASLTAALRATQFGLADEAIRARNENQFIVFELEYASRYAADAILRPSVRIEFMAAAPRCPVELRSFGPLIDEITKRTTAPPVTMACLAIDETFCEKIISYLRRATEHLSGKPHSQYEDRLARHIYDVHRIATLHYGQAGAPTLARLFDEILAAEVERYGNRDESFRADPAGTLRNTLACVSGNSELAGHYERFAAELVYGDERPAFGEAFATFETAAGELLSAAWIPAAVPARPSVSIQ